MLSAVIMAKKGVTVTTLFKEIKPEKSVGAGTLVNLYVDRSEEDCNAVAAAMNSASFDTMQYSLRMEGAICGNTDPAGPKNRLYFNGTDCYDFVVRGLNRASHG